MQTISNKVEKFNLSRVLLFGLINDAKDLVVHHLRSVHTRRQVAATRRGDISLNVYRSGD